MRFYRIHLARALFVAGVVLAPLPALAEECSSLVQKQFQTPEVFGVCMDAGSCSAPMIAVPGGNCAQGQVCCADISKAPANMQPAGQTADSPAEPKENEKATGIDKGKAVWGLLNTTTACRTVGKCTLDDLVATGINVARFLLGLSGALFFAMFVYGGGLYLISFGNAGYVGKGKKAISGAAIGFAIVISAWTIVRYVATAIAPGYYK